MMSTDSLSAWKTIAAGDAAAQRGFEGHPLRLHFGVDELGRPIFFLRTSDVPPKVELSDVVKIEVRHRPDFAEWLLLLTLQDTNYQDTFMELCIDLAGRSGEQPNEEAARREFFRTLKQFDDLFARRRSPSLSEEEVRGLVAELWFALRVVVPETSHSEALCSWKGPFGAPQDFRLDSGELFEIKAIYTGSGSIRISSADQLDPTDSDGMTLTVITLEECGPGTTSGVSLRDLVDEFEAGLAAAGEDLAGFRDRLKAVGVGDSINDHQQRFVVERVRYFDVRDGFPRINRAAVPLGVDSLQYRLKLQAIADFELGDATSRLRPINRNSNSKA